MAWRFRKSFTVMPGVRLNVSRRGVSATLGAGGPLSLKVGPRGTYVNANLPGSGLSYRQRLGGTASPGGVLTLPPPDPSPSLLSPEFAQALSALRRGRVVDAAKYGSALSAQQIRSASTAAMTSPPMRDFCDAMMIAQQQRDEIARELETARRDKARHVQEHREWDLGFFWKRVRKARFSEMAARAGEANDRVEELEEQHRLSNIATDFEVAPEHLEAYSRMVDAFAALSQAAVIWDTTSSARIDQVRERSAAHNRVERRPVKFGVGVAEVLSSDQRAPHLENANGGDLFLYPGVVLYRESREVFAVLEAQEVTVRFERTHFLEQGAVPADSQVVGRTWTYVNKNGMPDRRFSFNPEIPMVAYGELHFRSASGLCESYMVSNMGAAERFANEWTTYAEGACPRLTP